MMRSLLVASLVALEAVSWAHAGAVAKLNADRTRAGVGEPVSLYVEGTDGRPLVVFSQNTANPAATITELYRRDESGAYVLHKVEFVAREPGLYELVCYPESDRAPQGDDAPDVLAITVGDVPPPPDPDPKPEPEPGPKPEPGPDVVPATVPLFVAYVLDAASETPQQAAIRTDAALRAELDRLGVKAFRSYVSTESDIDAHRWRARLDAAGYPAVLVQRYDTGAIVAVGRVASSGDVAATVRKVRGQ